MLGVVLVDPVLDLVAVVTDQSLDWPGCSVSQRADCVPFDLLRQLPQHVDFSVISVADLEALHCVCQPGGSFSAGRALTAALMLVELGKTEDALYYIGLVVHHDHCCCSQSALQLTESVKVHQHVLA